MHALHTVAKVCYVFPVVYNMSMHNYVCREEKGLGYADMLAGTPSLNSGRSVQSFARSPHSAVPSGSLLATNDRVVISRQDGSGWAISMGTITDVLPGPQVRVVLDKPVPHKEDVLYRIDQVSGYSGGAAYCNLADLCTSDSEK